MYFIVLCMFYVLTTHVTVCVICHTEINGYTLLLSTYVTCAEKMTVS